MSGRRSLLQVLLGYKRWYVTFWVYNDLFLTANENHMYVNSRNELGAANYVRKVYPGARVMKVTKF